ncbi:MAG: methylated-DNA--[protein]-cysteine S-methyltransferase [Terracidiphilus sp.]
MSSTVLHFALDHLPTPIGDFYLVADDQGNLRATFWTEQESEQRRFLARHYAPARIELTPARNPHGLTDRLAAYFAGNLHSINAIPVRTAGTQFQQTVWRALRDIPCGTTTSYGELARRLGQPAAVRAVGTANGANPIGVVVPCHRVIGANGSLTGYGGGIERKRWLLEHEGVHPRDARLF